MKRKYLALALGLALTFTSMNVAFAATDSTTKITTEAADTKMLPQMTQLIKAVLQETWIQLNLTNLTESSKFPASIAKSNKQWAVGGDLLASGAV